MKVQIGIASPTDIFLGIAINEGGDEDGDFIGLFIGFLFFHLEFLYYK